MLSLKIQASNANASGFWEAVARQSRVLLWLPALAFVLVFFLFPAALLLGHSVFVTHADTGAVHVSFSAYLGLLGSDLFIRVALTTLKIAVVSTLGCAVVALPLALVIAYGGPFVGRLTLVLTVLPLLVSVIVRAYGWQLLLGNNQTGVLNWILHQLFASMPFRVPVVQLLYTQWAVVVASIHVFLPLMVLPIAGSLGRVDPTVHAAAQMLGANSVCTFWRVTFPLSLPGLLSGVGIVFSLTSSSYVIPSILGGPGSMMLGNLLEQQMTTAYDWTRGGAIGVMTTVIAVGGLLVVRKFTPRRMR
ncbi:ABC transporter permease [Paraburkholderia tropica]|uniref:ABC transporter permease n=1 Tax=Paraburkholderia tropica TaxID=92647 RepID=UPI002AB6976E|nr:ABC transporter permease [Paraburkholderia tropica]